MSTLTLLGVKMKFHNLDMRVCQDDRDSIVGTVELMFLKDDYERHKECFDEDFFLLQYSDAYGASHEYRCAVDQIKVEWGWKRELRAKELRAVEIDFHVVQTQDMQT